MEKIKVIDLLNKIANGEEIIDICTSQTLEIFKKEKEIERLNNIIKEVREYIEELAEDNADYIGAIDRRRKVELLEILDKVEENK